MITANVGTPQTSIALPQFGASAVALEILGATGAIGSTIRIGSAVTNTGEILVLDPSTLTLNSGFGRVSLSANLRTTEPMVARVVAGSGAGTYQIRVHWYGA